MDPSNNPPKNNHPDPISGAQIIAPPLTAVKAKEKKRKKTSRNVVKIPTADEIGTESQKECSFFKKP